MSSRYLATVRRVTSIPFACSRAVICSSVSGCARSSSSIIFLTLRFRISSGVAPPPRALHGFGEEVAQLEDALRRVRVLAGHRAADGGRMHADLLGHFLDHHGLQLVDAVLQKIHLAPHDGLADFENGLLALLDVLHQLDGRGVALLDVIADFLGGSLSRSSIRRYCAFRRSCGISSSFIWMR